MLVAIFGMIGAGLRSLSHCAMPGWVRGIGGGAPVPDPVPPPDPVVVRVKVVVPGVVGAAGEVSGVLVRARPVGSAPVATR